MKIGDINVSDVVQSAVQMQRMTAANNLVRVRGYMTAHLGCSPKEVAYALDLSWDQARRAFRKVRSEWQK